MATGDQTDTQQREVLIAQAALIETRHQQWADAQQLQAAWWRRWDTLLKASAAVLAAASGGAGLASERFRGAAGVAALGAAVLGAMGGAFGSSNRSEEYFGSAAANQTLVDRARDFRTTVAPHQPLDEVRKRFTELCEERDNTVARSPLRLGVRATKLFRGDRTPSALDRALGNQKPAGD